MRRDKTKVLSMVVAVMVGIALLGAFAGGVAANDEIEEIVEDGGEYDDSDVTVDEDGEIHVDDHSGLSDQEKLIIYENTVSEMYNNTPLFPNDDFGAGHTTSGGSACGDGANGCTVKFAE